MVDNFCSLIAYYLSISCSAESKAILYLLAFYGKDENELKFLVCCMFNLLSLGKLDIYVVLFWNLLNKFFESTYNGEKPLAFSSFNFNRKYLIVSLSYLIIGSRSLYFTFWPKTSWFLDVLSFDDSIVNFLL